MVVEPDNPIRGDDGIRGVSPLALVEAEGSLYRRLTQKFVLASI